MSEKGDVEVSPLLSNAGSGAPGTEPGEHETGVAGAAAAAAEKSSAASDVDAAAMEHSVENVQVASEDNTSKFQVILGLLRKMVGVKDIVGMRISLPAQLLDPISNLEYWNYMDRPDYFSVISDPDDPVERMAAVVRWYLSKDLKFVKDKLVKAYNSTLGEQFLAEYNTQPATPPFSGTPVAESAGGPTRKVAMMIEQISHHPPISAFCYECQEKGIVARGLDQIAAKFTGTAVRITPGEENRGIYIVLSQRDGEEYACTHPTAYINGWLRCSLYISVSEIAVITCEKTGLQAVLEYKDEKWFSKAKNAVEGRIFKLKGSPPPPSLTQLGKVSSKSSLKKTKRQYDTNKSMSFADIERNPCWTPHRGGIDMKAAYSPEREGETVARISGSWKGEMTIQRGNSKPVPFLDMQNIECAPKEVRPISEQHPKESRRIWHEVSEAIRNKEFSKATALKHALEEEERNKARQRKESGEEFVPVLFLPEELWCRPGVPVMKREVTESRPYLPKAAVAGQAQKLGDAKFVISPTGAVETSGEA